MLLQKNKIEIRDIVISDILDQYTDYLNQMEKIADDIESELYQYADKEVSSTEIGERVMNHLKELDEVAYVRFASVHKRFSNIETFLEELTKLRKSK